MAQHTLWLLPAADVHCQVSCLLSCSAFQIHASRCLQRDPARYGVPRQPTTDALDRWLRDRLLMGCLRELAEHGMVGCDVGRLN